MTDKTDKYARPEHERRFLLAERPRGTVEAAHIVDRYIEGTRLRLRSMQPGPYKLTQKLPPMLTTIYLDETEYGLLARLPAAVLHKTRHRLSPMVVDVFEGPLDGLVLAEAEFTTAEEVRAYAPPPFVVAEVTDDERFTGGRLATTTAAGLGTLLAGFGLSGRRV